MSDLVNQLAAAISSGPKNPYLHPPAYHLVYNRLFSKSANSLEYLDQQTDELPDYADLENKEEAQAKRQRRVYAIACPLPSWYVQKALEVERNQVAWFLTHGNDENPYGSREDDLRFEYSG